MESWIEKLGLGEVNAGVFDGAWSAGGETVEQISPIDGRRIAYVQLGNADDYERAVRRAEEAFSKWRLVPAPVRGDTIRRFGNALRDSKKLLGRLVTLETGKILSEGEGEVQEMIAICDLAVG